jgi:head-tail adaptor
LNPALWDCSIQAATARNAERLVAGTIQTSATHLLRGDFHPGITTETRITYRGVQYEVQSVQNDDERDLSLTLICMAISESDSGAQSIAAARRAGPGGRAAATARGVHD